MSVLFGVSMTTQKLVKSQASITMPYPPIVQGFQPQNTLQQRSYPDTVKLSRFFFSSDPIAHTVINRVAEISSTRLRNKRKSVSGVGTISDTEFEMFNAVATLIQPHIPTIILSYLIDGMAIPQYEISQRYGSTIIGKLGRGKFYLPDKIWLRDSSHVKLYRTIHGYARRAVITIPIEDIRFITSGGMRSDGMKDVQAFNELQQTLPEYVAAVQSGATVFPVDDYIIYRKLLPYNDYPIPYLSAALDSLDHKRYIKMMDRATASRAIESIRHVTVGSDEYPADDEDIEAAKTALQQNSSVERVYNFFTNHTIKMEWVVPPLDILLDKSKYEVANEDIFFALGFPRILTVGETEKSNSADNKIAALGVLSMLETIQNDVLQWVKHVYQDIAERNNIRRIPEPYFTAVKLADVANLIQYARDMLEKRVVSRNTVAEIYGTSFEDEIEQIMYEDEQDDTNTDDQNTMETPTLPEQLRVSPPQEPNENTDNRDPLNERAEE